MKLSVAPDLAAIVRAGALWLEGATVVDREPRLNAPLAAAESAARISVSGRADAAAGGPADVTAVRAMYKRVGLDPTKTRPSSEALLRRVRKGDTLPRINSMVDVCNWCSLEFQLPYGLYDANTIAGDVELRLGRPGESYAGIRKDDVRVENRITLADRVGPFGNPTSDSSRTMVTTATTRGLLVVFAPREFDERRLTHVLDVTSARMHEFTGGAETARFVG